MNPTRINRIFELPENKNIQELIMREKLDFQFKSIEEGIQKTVEWFLNNK